MTATTPARQRSCLSSPCLSCSSTSACSDGSSSNSSSSNNTNPCLQRHVSFASLSIREYELGLGDHPCVSSGPPVSIGWTYIPETESCMSVDEYESSRPPRRSASQMVMPRALRESLLSDIVEYTRRDIQEAIRKAKKIKIQRQQTMRKLNMAPYEEALQNIVSRMKKISILGWRNRKNPNYPYTSSTSTNSTLPMR